MKYIQQNDCDPRNNELKKNSQSYQVSSFGTVLVVIRIANQIKQALKIPLKKFNISVNQWLVLKIIYMRLAETSSKITLIMNTDAAAITRYLDYLEIRGFVKRERQTHDRRVIVIKLTSKGLNTAEKVYKSYAEIFNNFEKFLMQDELSMWRLIKSLKTDHEP